MPKSVFNAFHVMGSEKSSPTQSVLESQLFGYSLAASAVLAVAPQASAEIIYNTSLNQTFSEGSPAFLDLDAAYGDDLRFFVDIFACTCGGEDALVAVNSAATTGPYWSVFPYPIPFGSSIGSGIPSWGGFGPLASGFRSFSGVTSQSGPFAYGARGYLPFRIRNEDTGDFHYGWIDVEVNDFPDGGTIYGWAWENTPNAPITAGAVPEPAHSAFALGLLALGAAGVRRYKRSQASKAAALQESAA